MTPIWKPLQRIFNNPSLMTLLIFGSTLWLAFYFAGRWLMPVIIAIVIAYLLEGLIQKLESWNMRRIFAVCLVFFAFFAILTFTLIALLPTLIDQAKSFATSLPAYLSTFQQHLHVLPERFPQFFNDADIASLIQNINNIIADASRNIFSGQIFATIGVFFSLAVYAVLIPILIFFFLKDKTIILKWLGQFLPENRQIITEIWTEVDQQIGNYIRGKFFEIIIVWFSCFITFYFFGLQYPLLLSFVVGLSVLIPYIGAAAATLPVLVVAYMQFGFTSTFWWLIIIYTIIQLIDGNVIVPLIFSEAVNIHPIALIIAVLIFGGLWGFWGVFFAIPLATLVKAIMKAWQKYEPRNSQLEFEGI